MNLVGKILTGIIALFSIIFMSLVLAVYATHQNWKVKAQGLQNDLTTAKKDKDALADQHKTYTESVAAEKKELTERFNNLKTEADVLKKDRDTLKAQLDDLDKKFRESNATMAALQQNTANLQKEVDGLRTENAKVRTDYAAKFAEVVEKTDKLHQAANMIAGLNAQKTVIAEDLAKAKDVLNKFGLKAEPALYAGIPPHPLYGKVLANPGNGLIEVSLGSDDGLAKGHKLEVYRISGNASSYLGRIEVVETSVERSVAKILPDFQKGIIQKGDDVASQFKFSNVAANK